MQTIFVLYGGISVEHEVSITSAHAVINKLNRDKYHIIPVYINKTGCFCILDPVQGPVASEEDLILESKASKLDSMADFLRHPSLGQGLIFSVIHGTYGEDGTLQGFLEMLDIPYTGDGVLASSLCMDKGMTNDLFHSVNIPQCKYRVLDKFASWDSEEVLTYLGLPLYVKPCNSGSSVGVTKVEAASELAAALDHAFLFDHRIVLEEAIEGVELQIAVLGNHQPIASRPGVYGVPETYGFFDYEAKYKDDATQLLIPYEELSQDMELRARHLAEKAYRACQCQGYARVDIFVEKGSGRLLVNEINTSPGMTSHSMFPQLWQATEEYGHLNYSQVLDKIIDFAVENHQRKKEFVTTRTD